MTIEQARADLLALLRHMFQLESAAELDFGIYRVLRRRREQINDYLEKQLPQTVQQALQERRQDMQQDVATRFAQTKQRVIETLGEAAVQADGRLQEMYSQTPLGKEYNELRARVEQLAALEQREIAVYHDLLAFFERYYEEGDFGYQRRYSEQPLYALPGYAGQDVAFHWASRGQHYVKTGSRFSRYRFNTADADADADVEMLVVEAAVSQNNVKDGNRYYLLADPPLHWDAATRRLEIRFAFRPLSAAEAERFGNRDLRGRLVEAAFETLAAAIPDPALRVALCDERDAAPPVLRRHLARYMRGNSSDFFIHPRLKSFLAAELNRYINSEVARVSEINVFRQPEQAAGYIARLHALQQAGGEIISLLDQIELFQSRVFRRAKFLLPMEYLVTLDRLPDSLRETVFANEAQRAAWRQLFDFDGTAGDAPPSLVVDTRYFTAGFKAELLASFADLDAELSGICLHSENYQALRLLQARYQACVKCIYIDPPYNTGGDGFLYKDDFQRHATWLAMLDERLRLARDLLSPDGVIFVSIDDHEQAHLKLLMDEVFGAENFVATVIWQKAYAPKSSAKQFSEDHEYLLVYAASGAEWQAGLLARTEQQESKYRNPENDPRGLWRPNNLAARNYYSKGTYTITCPGGRVIAGPPKGSYWRLSEEKLWELHREGRIWWGEDGNNVPAPKIYLSEVKQGRVPQTMWLFKDVGHSQEAKKELLSIVDFADSASVFATPKPTRLIERALTIGTSDDGEDLILDFFAGSGTTAHAVIDMNREDDGRRKFLLVEMGEYFDTVLLPRVQRAIYAADWKEGRPQPGRPLRGASALLAYAALEQYEDALNAVAFRERSPAEQAQLQLFPDYLPEHSLLSEGELLNTAALAERPFAYTLSIGNGNGGKVATADVPATFALLIGLRLRRQIEEQQLERRYLLQSGDLPGGDPAAIIWRDTANLDLAADREVLADLLERHAPAARHVYVNGDCVLPAEGFRRYRSEDEFLRLVLP